LLLIVKSKGGILEKTVQYLMDVKNVNQQLLEQLRSLEMIKHENEMLREQVSKKSATEPEKSTQCENQFDNDAFSSFSYFV
jgi:regulator of replication initiation timing